jgi:hypothetical protein
MDRPFACRCGEEVRLGCDSARPASPAFRVAAAPSLPSLADP